jgi:ATP-dependent protease ClpP protease subunit
MRPCFNFHAATKTKPAILSIDDEIGFWGVQAKDFRASLDAIADKELQVEINSPGGDVMAGTAMFNMLRAWAKDGRTVTTKATGVVASIASVVFLAGDKRQMPRNTFAMVHAPWTVTMGNAEELRDQADTLDKIATGMVKTYVDRTGLSEDEVKALLSQDTWMTADEALDKGFATELTDEIKATAKFDMARAELPEHVAAVFKAEETPADTIDSDGSDATAATDAIDEPTLADHVQALAVRSGLGDYAPLWAVSFTSIAEVEARIAEAREIKALCVVAKKPEQADAFVKGGKTLAEARTALVAAMAEKDADTHTDNSVQHTQATGKSASSRVSTASIWKKHKAAK